MAETNNFLSFYLFTSCKMNLSKHDTIPKRASCTETDSNKWLKLTKCLFSPKKYLIHCPNQKESCLFTVFVRATCLMSTRTPPAQGYSKETLYHLMRTESSLRLSGTPSWGKLLTTEQTISRGTLPTTLCSRAQLITSNIWARNLAYFKTTSCSNSKWLTAAITLSLTRINLQQHKWEQLFLILIQPQLKKILKDNSSKKCIKLGWANKTKENPICSDKHWVSNDKVSKWTAFKDLVFVKIEINYCEAA